MSALPPYEGANLPIPFEGIQIVVVCILFETLAIIATFLRLWSRRITGSKLVLNDIFLVIAVVFTSALVADLLIAVYMGGEGQHSKFLGLKELSVWSRVFFTGQLLWAAANCAVKISILHLYLTIFVGRLFRILCFILMGLSTAYMSMTILVDFLICTPVALNWDDFVPGHCGSQRKAYLYTGIINLLIDVCIVVLPMPLLWGLQMPLSRKIGLSIMFGLGAVICVLTILRINSVQLLDLTDVTFSCAPLALWTVLEPTLGIVNACLPVMRPALQKLFGAEALRSLGLTIRSTWNLSTRNKGTRKIFGSWGQSSQTRRGADDGTLDSHRLNDFHHLEDDSYSAGRQSQRGESRDHLSQGNERDTGGRMIKVTNVWEVQTIPVNSHDLV